VAVRSECRVLGEVITTSADRSGDTSDDSLVSETCWAAIRAADRGVFSCPFSALFSSTRTRCRVLWRWPPSRPHCICDLSSFPHQIFRMGNLHLAEQRSEREQRGEARRCVQWQKWVAGERVSDRGLGRLRRAKESTSALGARFIGRLNPCCHWPIGLCSTWTQSGWVTQRAGPTWPAVLCLASQCACFVPLAGL